ncbi:MAG: hypothetical protein H6701_12070 [Myxococcales bacterium]|nr:hypothetical protein [Myxococcales bacterium]
MTPKLPILLLIPTLAAAQPPAPAPDPRPEPDPALEALRTPFEALTERAIGRTSRRVRYDWRKATLEAGLLGGLPAELNNFDSLRAGAFVRVPVSGFLLGLEATYVWVWGSESSDKLALTPYRQPGRPDRVELDATFTLPLAEGIVTAWPAFMPAAQLVLQSHAHLRYLLYPGGFDDLDFVDTLRALFSGSLTDEEIANLEDERLPGMQIDPGRIAALVGLGADLYFQSGLFFRHEILIAVPLFAPLTESELGLGLELNLATGISF